MRDLDTLTTHEMTAEEWQEFRRKWIESYANEIIAECDVDPAGARELEDIRFEDYVGQEGYTGRDKRICALRDIDKYIL